MIHQPFVMVQGAAVRSSVLGLLIGMALAGGGGALAQEFQRPPRLTLEDRPTPLEAFRIPRDQLATQDSHPFLFLGRVVDEAHPRWSDFRRAIRNHPDVDSCLEEDQRGTAEPDLLAFDWNNIGLGYAPNVCLFRVFQSLREPELIEAWLLRQGFRTLGFDDPQSRATHRALSLSASWTPEQYGSKVLAGRPLRPIWDLLIFGHSYVATVSIGDNGLVTTVGFGPVSK